MVTIPRNHNFNEADFELLYMLLQPQRQSYNLL
jgi:hypothetical protein